jgi:1,4-dihydroxy-2-naphthoate octaprenyltransferase
MISKLKSYGLELRAAFLTATVVSVFLGASIAYARNQVFYLGFFILSLIAGIFLHLGTNVLNDYFDHKSGGDDINKEYVRPFSGGSRMIQRGLLTPREVLFEASVLYAIGAAIGVYLTIARGIIIMALGLVGMFSGIFYVGPPFKLANRGAGEIFVGVNFGVLMTMGAYYVQTQELNVEPFVASIPVAFLIFAVVYINEFPDYVADKAVGKNTMVVRLGRAKAARGFAILMGAVYLSIAVGVVAHVMPVMVLISFFTLPIAVKAVKNTLRNNSVSSKLAPSNASTILCHLLTSLLISAGYLIAFFAVAA